MKTVMDFNLNDYILVQIKPEGFEHWHKDYNSVFEPIPAAHQHKKPLEYFTSQADKGGYVRMQAWHFMEIFGSTIDMSRIPLFHPTIKIEVETPSYP